MKAFSNIDMGEVTRLTRAGKLADAMALLRGETPHAADVANDASPSATLDMAPGAGGAWSLAPGELTKPQSLAHGDVGRALRNFGGRLDTRRRTRTTPASVPPGARFEERVFASDEGSLGYKIYVPSAYRGQTVPLVVMLHGCTQDPDDFAAGTGMNGLAEEHVFLVAYPRQPQSANMQKCWNWFDAAHQRRGGGEPSLIVGCVLQAAEEFCVDRTRIYVAGLSAGGAAAAILATTHPDLFAAVGVHSGLACGAARDMPSAFAAMGAGGVLSLRSGGTATPTIVFHGDADRTVHPVNGEHVLAQARGDAAMTEVVSHGESPGGVAYTRIVHCDRDGRETLEQWLLHGAGHAWSGGSASGSFTDPRGPDASREMVRFFLAHGNARAALRR